jgi:carbon storage regulator
MLVLSRKLHQEIVINENVRVRVQEIKGGRIRLGIIAPPDVSVRRQELPAQSQMTSRSNRAEALRNGDREGRPSRCLSACPR